jgi:hypothetical protein
MWFVSISAGGKLIALTSNFNDDSIRVLAE